MFQLYSRMANEHTGLLLIDTSAAVPSTCCYGCNLSHYALSSHQPVSSDVVKCAHFPFGLLMRLCGLFELNTCVWIVEKLFLFRFIVGWWRSWHLRYFVIGQNHLIDTVRMIVLKWSLTNAEFCEDAYAASIQTKDHKMNQKHKENARRTDNYRFAGLAPIQ